MDSKRKLKREKNWREGGGIMVLKKYISENLKSVGERGGKKFFK